MASIYLQRFKRNTILIDRGDSRVSKAPLIRNLVGYSQGISGEDLLGRLRKQAKKYGTKTIIGEATVKRNRKTFEVFVNGKKFVTNYVILATGFKDRHPQGIDYDSLCRLGAIAYCPICDGFDQSDKSIGIIIDSNLGFQKIEFLYGFTRRLHVIITKDLKIPARHLEKIEKFKIKVHYGSIQNLIYQPDQQRLIVKLENQRPFSINMAYVSMGFKVCAEAFSHLKGLRRTQQGLLLVNAHQETSVHGLFAIGDCVKSLAQVSVAVGHAAIASTAVHNRLN